MNINFELYKVFYEVANSKSISKGAKNLMISQPAVTQSIQTLENELGGKLFIRTPKGVILTNEGKELYSYIKNIGYDASRIYPGYNGVVKSLLHDYFLNSEAISKSSAIMIAR